MASKISNYVEMQKTSSPLCILLKQSLLIGIVVTSFSYCSLFKKKQFSPPSLTYFFDQLHSKDINQMKQLIRPLLKSLKQLSKDAQWSTSGNPEVKHYLDQALTIALSKPPFENMTAKLVRWIYQQGSGQIPLIQSLYSIIKESILHFKDKNRSDGERATYLYVLENTIREIRPFLGIHPSAKEALTLVMQSNIKIPSSVLQERYNKILDSRTTSPSLIAQQVLQSHSGQK